MTRDAALCTLLASLFSAEELRRHLALEREGGELQAALPDMGVSPAALTHAAVDALKRRGFIDRYFFDNLEVARPRRIIDIRTVRHQWLHNVILDRAAVWADGRYQLDSVCGLGGFGLVWKAVDTWTGAFVALKILLEHHADDRRVRQRFFRGAAVLARLNHPAIVSVRSGVEQEGLRFFYVMDFIEGVGLDTLVGKRPHNEMLEYLLQIGDALSHIHAFDLLHRDINPTNILITRKRQAKLIDFDLVTGDAFAPTTTALGTAIFAPPEAATSDSKTAAYDVFSLARTVEYVIRGRAPTFAELAALDPVASLDTSSAVQEVLRAALQKDPEARTRSVNAFCDALRDALKPRPHAHQPPVTATPTPILRRLVPSALRNPAVHDARVSTVGALVSYQEPCLPHATTDRALHASPLGLREVQARFLALLSTPALRFLRLLDESPQNFLCLLHAGPRSFVYLLNARKDHLAALPVAPLDTSRTVQEALQDATINRALHASPLALYEVQAQFLALLSTPALRFLLLFDKSSQSVLRLLHAGPRSFLYLLNARKDQLTALETTVAELAVLDPITFLDTLRAVQEAPRDILPRTPPQPPVTITSILVPLQRSLLYLLNARKDQLAAPERTNPRGGCHAFR